MFDTTYSIGRIVAAGALAASLALVQPALAQNAAPSTQPAQASPAPAPAAAPAKHSPLKRVEARIADLHKKLKITTAQEQQWSAFADVMRSNASAVDAVLQERATGIQSMNAVDDMRSYEKIADAHADGLRKLVPAFETLYDSMSDAQKKNADQVFGQFEHRPTHHHHA